MKEQGNQQRTLLWRFRIAGILAMTGWPLFLLNRFLKLGLEDRVPWLVAWWFPWLVMFIGLGVATVMMLRGVFCPQCKTKCEWRIPLYICPQCSREFDPGRIRGVD